MCGIIGYIGPQKAVPVILDSLKRLEYRGYDSAGVAFLENGDLEVKRSVGKLSGLATRLANQSYEGTIGLGHTRWATHGRPSEENAHPHRAGTVAIVHNGIIENYLPLKKKLMAAGVHFKSETDTEVMVHLITQYQKKGCGLEEAVRGALKEVHGSYAIGVISKDEPDMLIAARNGCPLVLGIGQGETFMASDIPAILHHTREMILLDDGEMAVLTGKGAEVKNLNGRRLNKTVSTITWSAGMAEKSGYSHFMLKEIHEQPRAILDTIRGRIALDSGEVHLEELKLAQKDFDRLKKIMLIACGTSWHAALVGKYVLEELTGLPVEVDISSEFRYRDPLLEPNHLVVAITQSGETADTLAAIKLAKTKKSKTAAITNVVGSSVTRMVNGVIYTHAGPEIGVASTKAFTTQLVALYLLGVLIGRKRKALDRKRSISLLEDLVKIPQLAEEILKKEEAVKDLAQKFYRYRDFLYLGRGVHYPIALEGALKLKEISYIHAEGYPAGEMKHGPIALIDEEMPVVVLAPLDKVYEKTMSNVMEVKARGGKVIALVTEGNEEFSGKSAGKSDEVIELPAASPLLTPILMTIPLQLLAYHIAILLGCDVDQPRNLAKSVTVE
jgi:glucosamine--fructose-6-phosphate aminotransferase (isomerizing)